MVLYCAIGIDIVKRKQAFRTISNDAIPLDVMDGSDVHDGEESVFAQLLCDYIILTLTETVTLYRRPPTRSSLSFRQYILMPLMIFVVLLVIWVAPTTNRVASFTNPAYLSSPLLIAVGATGSLRGFWNGVVFITIGMKARKGQSELDKTPSQGVQAS